MEERMLAKESFAQHISGREYPFQLSDSELLQAKAAGLVVVYGASDDLMEFEGAINEELGEPDGKTVIITGDGLFDENACGDECKYFEMARERARKTGATIKAIWAKDDISWQYETDIPHATFEIMENGEMYCRGIVFALADVERKA